MISGIFRAIGIFFIILGSSMATIVPDIQMQENPPPLIIFFVIAVYFQIGLGTIFLLEAQAKEKDPEKRNVFGFSFQLDAILTLFSTLLGVAFFYYTSGIVGDVLLTLFLIWVGRKIYLYRVHRAWAAKAMQKAMNLAHTEVTIGDILMGLVRLIIEILFGAIDVGLSAVGGGGGFSGGGASGSW